MAGSRGKGLHRKGNGVCNLVGAGISPPSQPSPVKGEGTVSQGQRDMQLGWGGDFTPIPTFPREGGRDCIARATGYATWLGRGFHPHPNLPPSRGKGLHRKGNGVCNLVGAGISPPSQPSLVKGEGADASAKRLWKHPLRTRRRRLSRRRCRRLCGRGSRWG